MKIICGNAKYGVMGFGKHIPQQKNLRRKKYTHKTYPSKVPTKPHGTEQ